MIAIGLMAFLLLLIISFFSANLLNFHSKYTVQATSLMASEIEGVRQIDFDEIADKTNASFFTKLYTVGNWSVISDTSNAFEVASSADSGVTGMVKAPINGQEDFTLEAKMKVGAGAPAGWAAGFIIRAQENDRYYRFLVKAGEVVLEKVEPSGITVLSQTYPVISVNNWNTYTIDVSGTQFDMDVGVLDIDTVDDNNATWFKGDVGLIALEGPNIRYDDIKIGGATITDGDFEAVGVNEFPTSWDFFQPTDLPSGAGTITIADYAGSSEIKEVTANMTWLENSRNRTLNMTSLISE
ncbi:hypothetical protein ACFL04_04505 [Patescibacteria group bacterium]